MTIIKDLREMEGQWKRLAGRQKRLTAAGEKKEEKTTKKTTHQNKKQPTKTKEKRTRIVGPRHRRGLDSYRSPGHALSGCRWGGGGGGVISTVTVCI